MNKQNSGYLKIFLYAVLFLLCHLFTYNPFSTLKIGNAVPFMMIAAVITVSFYYGEWWGFTAGIISGAFADAVTSNSFCFNAIFLLFVGTAAGLLLKQYLNHNIFSALTLSGVSCGIFFFIKGLYFMADYGAIQGFEYLLLHSLPSAVYSALFIIPFYYIGKLLNKI